MSDAHVAVELCVPDGGPIDRRSGPTSELAHGVSVVVCTYARPDSLALLLKSLGEQDGRIHELLVVDASADDNARSTQDRIRASAGLAGSVRYWQLQGPARGLTRQRNFALARVTGDLVLFLDDDVILEPECVREMEEAHRAGASAIAGVGCFSRNQFDAPSFLWRLRRALGIVPSLQPGRYWRSGLSIPWSFERPSGALVDGDWLPGFAMMWKTSVARILGFDQAMEGYAQGEDLDFSLRARQLGRLVMLGNARLEHRPQPAGRPNAFQLGYMELRNRFAIHRRALPARSRRDVLWFTYAWTLDTVLLARHLVFGRRRIAALQQIAGRLLAAKDLCLEGCALRRIKHGH